MALINCPECSKRISDQSTACPGCGCPTPKSVPIYLAQTDYNNDNSLVCSQRQENNGCASAVFLLIVVLIGYALVDLQDDYSTEAEQYSEYQSRPYEDPITVFDSSVPIPMLLSGSGENGRYFLISHSASNNIEYVDYVRRGSAGDAFGKMQIDCINNKIRKTSSANPESLVSADLGQWYTPTPDWTDQDIVNFICK